VGGPGNWLGNARRGEALTLRVHEDASRTRFTRTPCAVYNRSAHAIATLPAVLHHAKSKARYEPGDVDDSVHGLIVTP